MAIAEEAVTPLIKQDFKSTTTTSSNNPPANTKAAFDMWKVFVFGAFLVRIFTYSVQMRENTDQKNTDTFHVE